MSLSISDEERLKSETNTPEVQAEIEKIVKLHVVFEHGHWWVQIDTFIFSVVDSNFGGLELEQVN